MKTIVHTFMLSAMSVALASFALLVSIPAEAAQDKKTCLAKLKEIKKQSDTIQKWMEDYEKLMLEYEKNYDDEAKANPIFKKIDELDTKILAVMKAMPKTIETMTAACRD